VAVQLTSPALHGFCLHYSAVLGRFLPVARVWRGEKLAHVIVVGNFAGTHPWETPKGFRVAGIVWNGLPGDRFACRFSDFNYVSQLQNGPCFASDNGIGPLLSYKRLRSQKWSAFWGGPPDLPGEKTLAGLCRKKKNLSAGGRDDQGAVRSGLQATSRTARLGSFLGASKPHQDRRACGSFRRGCFAPSPALGREDCIQGLGTAAGLVRWPT